MIILGVDTSAKTVSVAVGNETAILSEAGATTALTHSQTMIPMLSSVLQAANLTIEQIDCFAVSVGPGSFTGLRIGIGAVKGMAYGTGKPCVGVSTLDALSRNLSGVDGVICAAMDARCSQVYTALFESTPAGISRMTEDEALTLDELLQKLQPIQKSIFFVGDGAQLCYNRYKDVLPNIFLASDGARYQRASSVVMAARDQWEAGNSTTPAALSPVYLRLPQAERERNRKQQSEAQQES